jgi:DNA-binding NarL/FixJ family response regulator
MTTEEYAWRRYADLQQRSSKIQTIDDYAWGVDSALMFLINAIQTSSLPSNPVELDLALKRVISSGARLRRSRDAALKKWMTPPDSMVTSTAAEANVELSRIAAVTTGSDQKILFDAGFGYTDREIAHRHRSTPGAIRVRLSRLRQKLGRTRLTTRRAQHRPRLASVRAVSV